MKHEYHEGPKAVENFERLARRLFFRLPKWRTRKGQTGSGQG